MLDAQRPKAAKDEIKRSKRPPTRSQGPQTSSAEYSLNQKFKLKVGARKTIDILVCIMNVLYSSH